MKQPDLQMLAHWFDPALVATLETRRRLKKEWHRRRKLATLQTLGLMLAWFTSDCRRALHEPSPKRAYFSNSCCPLVKKIAGLPFGQHF